MDIIRCQQADRVTISRRPSALSAFFTSQWLSISNQQSKIDITIPSHRVTSVTCTVPVGMI